MSLIIKKKFSWSMNWQQSKILKSLFIVGKGYAYLFSEDMALLAVILLAFTFLLVILNFISRSKLGLSR